MLFWFVGGMFDDLTFYQVRIIGGEMNQEGWLGFDVGKTYQMTATSSCMDSQHRSRR